MGASGAGKTTLLNVLTFRNNGNLGVSSAISINGKQIESSSQLAQHSAYVEQDDLFIGSLKVKEHLKFQAMLRIGKNATHEQKMERVEQVLNEVTKKINV